MKNKQSKLAKIISSTILATALLFPIKARTEEPKLTYSLPATESQSQTPQNFSGIFGKELTQKKPVNELDNMGLKDYQDPLLYEDPSTRKEVLTSLRISAEQLPFVKGFKQDFKELTDFRLYEKIEPEQSPETNVKPESKWLEIDAITGVRAYLDKRNLPAGEVYADFNKPYILGYELKKARAAVNSKGELELRMQRELDYDWVGEIGTQTNYSGLSGNLSISKELKDRSRVRISAGEAKEKGTFLELDYRLSY